jgi:hypothetical protein
MAGMRGRIAIVGALVLVCCVGGPVSGATGSSRGAHGRGSPSFRLTPQEHSSALVSASADYANCVGDSDGLEDFDFDQFQESASVDVTCEEFDTIQGSASADMSETATITPNGGGSVTIHAASSGNASASRVGGTAQVQGFVLGDFSFSFEYDDEVSYTLSAQLHASASPVEVGDGAGHACGTIDFDDVAEHVGDNCGLNNFPPSFSVSKTGTFPSGEGQLQISGDSNPVRFTNGGVGGSSGSYDWDVTVTLEPACPSSRSERTAGASRAAGQCAPKGHIVFVSPGANGNRVLVVGADPGDPSGPANGPLLLRGSSDDLDDPAWAPSPFNLIAVTDGKQIATMTDGGSLLTPVTHTATGSNSLPVFSHNGARIAFVSTRDGNPEIYVMDSNGSHQRRLTNAPGVDSTPTWSEDGSEIAFVSDRRGQFDVFAVNATGVPTAQRLTNDPAPDVRPEFVGNDTILFATTRDGNGEIYSMEATGGNPQNLTQEPATESQPVASPDGNFVAFLSNRGGGIDIYTMPVGGGAATNLTNSLGTPETEIGWGTSACNMYGSNGNDSIAASRVTVCGGAGDDRLTGGSGREILDGGMDDDRLDGKGGFDTLIGGDEDPPGPQVGGDKIVGGEGTDEIFGGEGNDTISGNGDDDTIRGGGGNDDIEGDLGTGQPGDDEIFGGPGADQIGGGAGDDDIDGDEGPDVIDGDAGFDTIFGDADKDVITACDGVRDAIFGGPGTRPGDAHDKAVFDRGVDALTSIEIRQACP